MAMAGCASPLFPLVWLDAHDAAKISESIAVRFSLRNAHSSEDLKLQRHEFRLQGGTGLYTCTNQAREWDILDDRDRAENADLGPGEALEGYLAFALCPDVAGPYTLLWDADGSDESASAQVKVRLLDSDAPLEPIEILAHSRNETARLD